MLRVFGFFLVVFLAFGLFVQPVQAERMYPKKWMQGSITLSNGSELKGLIRYDWRSDVVRFKGLDNQLWAGSVKQIQQFTYFDRVENHVRVIITVDFPITSIMTRPLFMEEVLTGSLTVYRRPHTHMTPRPSNSFIQYVFGGWMATDHENFDYYVYRNESFMPLDVFSQQFWPKLHKEMTENTWSYLTASNKLIPATLTGQLRLIARYNGIPFLAEPIHAE